jgi:cephalosporin hydroxylase
MIGRIAGDIDDHILNYYLVNHAAQELPAEALFIEIGVLFGGSLLVMMQALKDANLNRKIVAVDPLESYYGDSEDPITLLPITRDNVLRNIRSLNPHHDSFTLISTPSQSPQTVVSLQNIEIGVIYIDGDHSYEGVKSDWVNYSPLVVVGGYVLIDNYHDNYDGIDRFIDEELIPNCKSWAVAGMLNRSIVFVRQEN